MCTFLYSYIHSHPRSHRLSALDVWLLLHVHACMCTASPFLRGGNIVGLFILQCAMQYYTMVCHAMLCNAMNAIELVWIILHYDVLSLSHKGGGGITTSCKMTLHFHMTLLYETGLDWWIWQPHMNLVCISGNIRTRRWQWQIILTFPPYVPGRKVLCSYLHTQALFQLWQSDQVHEQAIVLTPWSLESLKLGGPEICRAGE